MKKLALALLGSLFFPMLLLSETIVQGDIPTQIWTLKGSPYHLIEDAQVLEEATLTIEPGVVVMGDPETILWVYGDLQATGSESQPILFTHADTTDYWDGVWVFHGDLPSNFTWCIFEYGTTYSSHNQIHGGAVDVGHATANFDHCEFRFNTCEQSAAGIYSNASNTTCTNCVFHDNYSPHVAVVGGDVDGTFDLSFCLFYDNVAGDGAPIAAFTDNGGQCIATMDHLTTWNNTVISTVNPETPQAFYIRSDVTLTNSIISISQGGTSQWPQVMAYNDIFGPGYNGGWIIGDSLLFEDPLFVNTDLYDFHLQADSPCINAGDPGFPLDDNGSPTDMGCYTGLTNNGGGGGGGNAEITLPDIPVLRGESFTLPVIVSAPLDGIGILSLEGTMVLPMEIIGSVDEVEFVADSHFPTDSWTMETNLDGDSLAFALAGTTPLRGQGPLFQVHMTLNEDIPLGDYPVELVNLLANEGDPEVTATGGSIRVVDLLLGDVSLNGVVQAFDASLLMRYLVGEIPLDATAQTVAEVSGNGELSSEDVALILQYVAGAIDVFPVQDGLSPSGSGAITLGYTPQESAQQRVDVLLDESSHIRSGTLPLAFNTEYMELTSVETESGIVANFQVESDGATLHFASPEDLSGAEQAILHLFFTPTSDAPNEILLQRVGGCLNDFVPLSDNQAITLQNSTSDRPQDNPLPDGYGLKAVYPNPFNPSTTIVVTLKQTDLVHISVYDMLGREVARIFNSHLAQGDHTFSWDAAKEASGVYLLKVQIGSHLDLRKVTLLH